MSRAEEITSEVRKLVLTCRAMEAQLQQSIPKKTHQEIVSKMQETIDGINADLERTKSDLQNTISVGERVNSLISKIASQEETIASLASHVSSQNNTIAELTSSVSTQKDVIEAQARTIEDLTRTFTQEVGAIGSMLSRDTVPVELYNGAQTRVAELEEKVRSMVERAEYNEVQKRCEDLAEQISTMVPRSEYITLQAEFSNYIPKNQFEDLERAYANSVPKETLGEIQARVADLEARLANSVPKTDYEELTARIASLTAMISTSSISLEVAAPTLEASAAHQVTVEETNTSPAPAVESPVVEVPAQAPALTSVVEVTVEQASQPPQVATQPEVLVVETGTPSTDAAPVQVETIAPQVTQEVVEPATVVSSQEPSAASPVVEVQAEKQQVQIQEVQQLTVSQVPVAVEEGTTNIQAPPVATVPEVTTEQVGAPATEAAVVATIAAPAPVAECEPAKESEVGTPVEPSQPQQNEEEQRQTQIEHTVQTTLPDATEQASQSAPQTVLVIEQVTARATSIPIEEAAQDTFTSPVEIASTEVHVESTEKREITEVQSQLSEINSAGQTGATSLLIVEPTLGFNFANTQYCARSGLEFLQDLERVSVEVLETHARNGDFERWFKDVLQDGESADTLRSIREGNYAGEELRMKLVAAVAPRYRA
ncbi:MAG TPA: hypothetical protein VFF30_04700 [Nitrososphaerales archaeon]|nr:hypothetical protein [Nitrososphaerales archaeon]